MLLELHSDFLDGLDVRENFGLLDLDASFSNVFGSLPDIVNVRPTGNYLYFAFLQDGALWRGNFRLDAADRDRGIIHFAIHGENGHEGARGRAFSRADGVEVTRAGQFFYVVRHAGKSVVFRLNDLRGVWPPPEMLKATERYLGPIEDESGTGFFLVFDDKRRQFLYVLDEARNGEKLAPLAGSTDVLIGVRSGFAYVHDPYVPRLVLAGVRKAHVERNSFFDGPFDQLPENDIDGQSLRRALEGFAYKARSLDRFGNYVGSDARVLARPYILYSDADQLAVFDRCVARAINPQEFHACFAVGQKQHSFIEETTNENER